MAQKVGTVKTTQERWRGHVAAWASSGLSCKAYASMAGVNPGTLAWWKTKLKGTRAVVPAPATFVEVTEQFAAPTCTEVGVIELEVGGTRIRVRGRVEPEALARVLDALEGRR